MEQSKSRFCACQEFSRVENVLPEQEAPPALNATVVGGWPEIWG